MYTDLSASVQAGQLQTTPGACRLTSGSCKAQHPSEEPYLIARCLLVSDQCAAAPVLAILDELCCQKPVNKGAFIGKPTPACRWVCKCGTVQG